jgi:serine/threonine protein kinase
MDKWRPGTEVEGDSCYMAPELMEEQYSRVTPAVDVFSLGATLFEMAANTILTPQDSALYEYLRSGIDSTSLCVINCLC